MNGKKQITINGLNLVYYDMGKGNTILFLHGALLCAQTYQLTLASLAKTYRVIAPDDHVHMPFAERVGDKMMYFMHGHELDPFIPKGRPEEKMTHKCLLRLFTYCSQSDFCCNEVVSTFFGELGEQLLRCWQSLVQKLGHLKQGHSLSLPQRPSTGLGRSTRLHQMMSRTYSHREKESYDTAIVGHTHRAIALESWYFNSGSWTRKTAITSKSGRMVTLKCIIGIVYQRVHDDTINLCLLSMFDTLINGLFEQANEWRGEPVVFDEFGIRSQQIVKGKPSDSGIAIHQSMGQGSIIGHGCRFLLCG